MFAFMKDYFHIFMRLDSYYTVSLASGELDIGQSSTNQPYRPRIRYTKLNFKVAYPCCSVMFLFWSCLYHHHIIF
jgi:hypothetical protein